MYIKKSLKKFTVNISLIAGISVVSMSACTNSARDSTLTTNPTPTTISSTSGAVVLKDASGAIHGTASFSPVEEGKAVKITLSVTGLTQGFHGVHIHDHGVCAPESDPAKNFTSAGKHYNSPENKTPNMSGELLNIFVKKDGSGSTSFTTDAVDIDELAKGTGTSIVIHEKASNFANIPARYFAEGKAGPDEATIHTDDAGNRILCGVISAGSGK